MPENRNEQLDPQSVPIAPLLAAEVLRNAATAGGTKPKGEEGISPLWRIFGATILSITALVAVTLYQQLAGGLTEVRHGLEQMTKKEDFVTSRTKVWEKFFEIEKKTEQGDVALADRCARLEQQMKDLESTRNETLHELRWLREANVAALKDRSALLEQQVKTGQSEHQEFVNELQQLRARLAALEGRPAGGSTVQPALPREK
jgi:hypothetical protein